MLTFICVVLSTEFKYVIFDNVCMFYKLLECSDKVKKTQKYINLLLCMYRFIQKCLKLIHSTINANMNSNWYTKYQFSIYIIKIICQCNN